MRKTRQELIREREDEISRIHSDVSKGVLTHKEGISELTSRFALTEFAAENTLKQWPKILRRRRRRREL